MASNLESIFKIFDSDGDGKLTCIEMHQALGASGCAPSVEEVQEAVKAKGSDFGDFALFKALYGACLETRISAAELVPLFGVVDPAKKGVVDARSLNYLLTNFNEKLTPAEADEFIQGMLGLPKEGTVPIPDVAQKLEQLQKI
ncbi:putative calmodulin [Neospora caninum Liverpool]|uniref:Calmodulin n=1 Tax=Neospora caninum (strain Liverpool) TaxID=572307 RepID=F0VGC8_NEOCL|nr:putative calmodulin [Neospora caninum Liverpool]CBZ52772.1 putative calmodulin [Neospora caninum Liverpool]CEL66754.1 TPA: calmodulin, putative [Neospora caninum Liverpool]|eukprot:XP_003882804.1 putative calmodulin [Neospora caninum Liverpool]